MVKDSFAFAVEIVEQDPEFFVGRLNWLENCSSDLL